MKRTYLLEYYPEMYLALNSNGITYILKLKIIWFWGLFTIYKETKYTIPQHHSLIEYADHWNNIIDKQLPLK